MTICSQLFQILYWNCMDSVWLSLCRHRRSRSQRQQHVAEARVCLGWRAGVVKSSCQPWSAVDIAAEEGERARELAKQPQLSWRFPWRICHMQTVINRPVGSASSTALSSTSTYILYFYLCTSSGHVNFQLQAHAPADLCPLYRFIFSNWCKESSLRFVIVVSIASTWD